MKWGPSSKGLSGVQREKLGFCTGIPRPLRTVERHTIAVEVCSMNLGHLGAPR